jgi:hypothetical protein
MNASTNKAADSAVSTTSIVNEMQELIDAVKNVKNMEIEKRVKLISTLAGNQLRAGALNLAYQRALSRLPEGSAGMVPQLNALPDKTPKE